MSAQAPVLTLEAVSHQHGNGPALVNALRDVSLKVYAGELVAVMGPSGSGKSTLLNIAGGLERPTKGTVIVAGHELSALDAAGCARVRLRDIGYVFQESNLVPGLSVLENIALPLELDGVATSEASAQARFALEAVSATDLDHRFPDELSGGQAQRATIARALVGHRKLLLADEPTGALDTAAGEEIISLLRQRADAGAACLMVTHEARHAAWADRTVFLRDGKVVDRTRSDRPETLLR